LLFFVVIPEGNLLFIFQSHLNSQSRQYTDHDIAKQAARTLCHFPEFHDSLLELIVAY
jgi:hypothetical protein